MSNAILALQLLGTLLTQALQVQRAVNASNASGTDITDSQLATILAQASADLNQLQTDITAAKAAGH